jgi:cysteine desulfuration protein SufE
MSLPAKLQERLDDLDLFPDRNERIQALIAIAEEFTNPDASSVARTVESKVPGCESEVFVAASRVGEGWGFRYAVDNPQGISAMALARILEDGLHGLRASEIQSVPDDVVYRIFGRELSMGKSLGLMGMVRMAKALAR